MSNIDAVTGKPILNKDGRDGPLTEDHKGMQVRHEDDFQWEIGRYAHGFTKMLFHPTQEEPTIPNAGFVRHEVGCSYPLHNHYFAQVWYILSGKFEIGGDIYEKGTMIFHPDPHVESALNTLEAGTILYVQYVGPRTGQGPVYEGRFNMKEVKPVGEETTAY